jgi:hypothetical protein
MDPRIISVVVPQKKWPFFKAQTPKMVWRVLSAFTGEPEQGWFSTQAEAEAALASSKKTEAHILNEFSAVFDEHQDLYESERAEILAAFKEGDIRPILQLWERLFGPERAAILTGLLRNEKTYRDTCLAVVGDGQVQ